MKRWSWCVVASCLALGLGCGKSPSGPDAGTGGGTSGFTGGGSSGVGGGSAGGGFATGGGMATGGGRATGGGAAGGIGTGGGAATGGGTAGGMGTGGGSMSFDGGGLVGGDTCSNAVIVSGSNIAITSTTTGLGHDYLFGSADMGCARSSSTGTAPDVVYAVAVPAGEIISASVTTTWDATINLIVAPEANCGDEPDGGAGMNMKTCVAGTDTATAGTDTASWTNTTGMAITVYVVIDGYSDGEGDFSLAVRVGAPPPGDTCTSATVVGVGDAGTLLPTETLDLFTNDYTFANSTDCEFLRGPDRVYSLVIPPNQRLTATATSASNLSLSTIDDLALCTASPVTCSAAVDNTGFGASQVETLILDNSAGMPRPVLLVVDSTSTVPTFSLAFSIGPIPAGDSCAMPVALALVDGGVTVTGEALGGFQNDYGFSTNSMDCAFENGADRVYTVPVGAGQRLEVTASSAADLVLDFVQDLATCQASTMVCASFADDTGSGSVAMPEIESGRYDNTTAASRTVAIIVDSYSSTGAGATFDLGVTVRPIPPPAYTVTMMSGTCDSFATITPTPVLTDTTTPPLDDDEYSDTVALPFAFSYFGSPATHYSASSNGFMQLFNSATGFGDSSASNAPIPTSFLPNGVIAPFWDDLDLIGPTTSKVVAGVFGTGTTRHFTVQWEQMMVYGVTGSSITFQARLFETTNVIELHACTLTAGTDPGDADLERGLAATVGVESFDGRDGVQHSYDTASLTAGQVIRFTP